MYIIYVNNTLPLALTVHEITRHFWAAYGHTLVNITEALRKLNQKIKEKRPKKGGQSYGG